MVCNNYNMGKWNLPDTYTYAQAQRPQPKGMVIYTCIRQILSAHVISSIYHFRHTIKVCPSMKVTAHSLYIVTHAESDGEIRFYNTH